jgi:hypothetical protein
MRVCVCVHADGTYQVSRTRSICAGTLISRTVFHRKRMKTSWGKWKCLKKGVPDFVKTVLHYLSFTRAWSIWCGKEILSHREVASNTPDYRLPLRLLTFQHRTSSIKRYKVRSSPRFVHSSAGTGRSGSLSIIYSIDCPSTQPGASSPTHLFRLQSPLPLPEQQSTDFIGLWDRGSLTPVWSNVKLVDL